MSTAPEHLHDDFPSAISPAKRRGTQLAIGVALGLGVVLPAVNLNVAKFILRYIAGNLSASVGDLRWAVVGYDGAFAITFGLAAGFGERLKNKRWFIISLITFIFASIFCGMSTGVPTFTMGRILQGVAGGFMLAKALSISFRMFSTRENTVVPAILGILSATLPPLLAPAFGGYIVDNYSWRWLFLLHLPLGFVVLILALIFVPAQDGAAGTRAPYHWLNVALATTGLVLWTIVSATGALE